MTVESTRRIEFSAAQSLVNWKNSFASLVKSEAKKLAAANGCEMVKWEHYQQAAEQAILDLGELIKGETNPNERRNAA